MSSSIPASCCAGGIDRTRTYSNLRVYYRFVCADVPKGLGAGRQSRFHSVIVYSGALQTLNRGLLDDVLGEVL